MIEDVGWRFIRLISFSFIVLKFGENFTSNIGTYEASKKITATTLIMVTTLIEPYITN
jgi:hypothetical protein